MKNVNRVRRHVPARDARITHDRDAGTYFLIVSGPFECVGKRMIRTQLMPDFVHDIVDIEIISHRNAISRRSNSASFLSVYANTTNTAGVSTTA